ncbi:hypothetical protein KSP40_PGU001629 [Platanthera guangdongensis]|uniref:Uncharacterized protein n=1 Tax=Platanthera guangdongensis TaxID=2320717 RepID=A0ABR2MMJ1_9ASPA
MISGIYVPRKKHISISKEELLEAILEMFGPEEADYILNLSLCLDSILHAEHKTILEEMRSYYPSYFQDQIQRTKYSTQTGETASIRHHSASNGSIAKETNFPNNAEDHKRLYLQDSLDLRSFFGSISGKANRKSSMDPPRIAAANHFQQSFMKFLYDAQFEELSAEDLLLTKSLNSDHLLKLPIYVDWKRAVESHAIIFRFWAGYLHRDVLQVLNRNSIGAECEMFLYDKFNEQIDMLVGKAMDTLMRLGLVSEFSPEANFTAEAISCSQACETLRKRWNSLLDV